MNVSSIIFDLDGTLLDTLGGLADTTNKVMQHFNFPKHSIENYRLFIGNGMKKLIERSVPVGTPSMVIEQCCKEFEIVYSNQWMSNCIPYDGVNDMLDSLQNQGIPLAILSNKPHQFTQLFVDEFFPKDIFKCVFGQREGFGKKPDPSVAVEIAKILRADINTTLFVGDSGVDIQTGKNANMKTAGVSWGFRPYEELVQNAPDILINHPTELLDNVIFSN